MQCKQDGGMTIACFVLHANDDLRAAYLRSLILDNFSLRSLLAVTKSWTGTWDSGLGDVGLGDVGLGDVGLGDTRGLGDVINKKHLTFSLNL